MKCLKMLAYKTIFLFLVPCLAITTNAQNKGKKGIEKENIDVKCKACEDFYQYADGGWIQHHPIPDDQSRWGNFSLLQQNNQKKLLFSDLRTAVPVHLLKIQLKILD